jgi:hypothetical protein
MSKAQPDEKFLSGTATSGKFPQELAIYGDQPKAFGMRKSRELAWKPLRFRQYLTFDD